MLAQLIHGHSTLIANILQRGSVQAGPGPQIPVKDQNRPVLCSTNKPQHPHLHTLPTVQLGPYIQVKVYLRALLLLLPLRCPRPPRIKVNHILDLLPAAIDDPIVPIKGRRVAQERVEPRARRHLGSEAREALELGPAALVPARPVQVRRLPLLDLLPGALVDGVVDGHDGAHVHGLRVARRALALQRLEEHLLRRVDPVSGARVRARFDLVVDGARRRRCCRAGRLAGGG